MSLDFLKIMESFHLGMERNGSVRHEPHNPFWRQAFLFESNRLKSTGFTFHHIGSTSIPGIKAKPILDILFTANDLNEIDSKKDLLEQLGYEFKGESGISGRRYCALYDLKKLNTYVHLHGFSVSHPAVFNHLYFRDYLLKNPQAAKEYESLKLKLSIQSRVVYSEEKSPYIEKILRLASEQKK